MNNKVNDILNTFNNAGYECYIVGGYVRDYLLDINSNDYDISTNASPSKIKSILKNYEIYESKYSTFHLKIDNINIEITPFRKEIKYYKRKPIKYEFVRTIKEDVVRRDFTINSLYLDSKNNIIDELDGINDLNNKIIRAIGDVDIKLHQDPLRILRAIRFSASLNFNIESSLEKGIIKYRNLLQTLSTERKRLEIEKFIKMKRLDILKKYNIYKYLDISVNNIVYYDDNRLVWLQIDIFNKYYINKKERKLLEKVKILNKYGLSDYNMYKYGLEASLLSAKMNNMSIIDRYNSLVIKKRKDIDISSIDILTIIGDVKLINKVYQCLEYKIINKELQNKYDVIMSYLLERKHTIY